MAQIAQVDDAQAIDLDDENRVLAPLHSLDIIVVGADRTNVNVLEGEVSWNPFGRLAFGPQSLNGLGLGAVGDDPNLGVIVVKGAHENQIGVNLMSAKCFDGMRIERYERSLGRLEYEERLAIPTQSQFWACIDPCSANEGSGQGDDEMKMPKHESDSEDSAS